MQKLITVPLAAATFVAALAAAAAAAAPTATNAHVTNDARNISISKIVAPAPKPLPRDESGIDRTFHPDYSQALTVDQMTAAWNDEINRVFETPITGGG